MKRAALISIAFFCIGMIWWTNPQYYLPVGTLISERDRQEIVTHIFIGHTPIGPWEPFCDVPYGDQMWAGVVEPMHWFYAYCTLYGIPSNWSGPVYSGDAPAPVPEPIPVPPPPKPGKGHGKGRK